MRSHLEKAFFHGRWWGASEGGWAQPGDVQTHFSRKKPETGKVSASFFRMGGGFGAEMASSLRGMRPSMDREQALWCPLVIWIWWPHSELAVFVLCPAFQAGHSCGIAQSLDKLHSRGWRFWKAGAEARGTAQVKTIATETNVRVDRSLSHGAIVLVLKTQLTFWTVLESQNSGKTVQRVLHTLFPCLVMADWSGLLYVTHQTVHSSQIPLVCISVQESEDIQ